MAQVAADGPQTRDISLPWNNSQIDAARRTFLDRHPLAKNKEQVALAKGEGVCCHTYASSASNFKALSAAF